MTNQVFPVSAGITMPVSHQRISSYFADPLQCLSAHLLFECSEVVAGVKPANLVSLTNRTRSCGRNLYALWKSHHDRLSSCIAGIRFKVLQTKERALLLFCYNPELLDDHLAHSGIRTLLAKVGYDVALSAEALLEELCSRITDSGAFPHEIGLFIGYPAKDVAAFMGMVKLPFACQALWKIYGNPDKSLLLDKQFKNCRRQMINLLTNGQLLSTPFPDITKASFYLPTN